jgi:hypothetical protein
LIDTSVLIRARVFCKVININPIAQANTNVDTNGKLMGDLISCRHKNEFVLLNMNFSFQ